MVRLTQLFFLFFCLLVTAVTKAERFDRADYYIEAYGRVSAENNPSVALADRVFETLVWVAQNQISSKPRLIVVNSKGRPWAIALPDNSVILSMGALRICDSLTVPETRAACIAFVLGHELAHLSNRDFWHHEAYLSLLGSGQVNNEYSDKEVELKADGIGYLYAALAGYPVNRVFNGKENLFDLWVSHTDDQSGDNNTLARNTLINERIQTLDENLMFAEYAIALTLFEKYDDAIPIYKELINIFPAKELLNNIGYSYLRLALRGLPDGEAQKFIFPAFFEANNVPSGMTKSLGSAYVHQLGNAIAYFEKALNINREYVPALYNLAVTQFYLGEYHEARAAIERAIKFEPNNQIFKMVRSIIIYEQETDIDMWPLTVTRLEAMAKRYPEDYLLKFNIAVMYEARGLTREAQATYQSVAFNSKNKELKKIACKQTVKSNCNIRVPSPRGFQRLISKTKLPSDTDPTSKRSFGNVDYSLYTENGAKWLYINGKPILYSTSAESSVASNFHGRCAKLMLTIALTGPTVTFCNKQIFKIRPDESSSNYWVDLSR